MKTTITIQTRTFPVTLRDNRTGETIEDTITLDKTRLQAAALVGMDCKELICRIYNREGYKVLDIGTPTKREVIIDPESGRAGGCGKQSESEDNGEANGKQSESKNEAIGKQGEGSSEKEKEMEE